MSEFKNRFFDNVASVDFETHYGPGYSLTSKSESMTEYIRDERFEAQTCAVMLDSWKKAEVGVGRKEIEELLHEVDWANTAFLGHHTQFDGLIATHHFDIVPVFWLDTMSISKAVYGADVAHSHLALSARLGREVKKNSDALKDAKGKYLRDMSPELIEFLKRYNADDAEETLANFRTIWKYLPFEELRIIDATIRMYCEPALLLDEPLLKALHEREADRRAGLVEVAGTTTNVLGSAPKFADLLRSLGVEPPMKTSKKTKKPTFAFAKTDLEFKALLGHPNEAVRQVVEARLANKGSIVESRSKRLLRRVGLPTPVYLSYAAARTLRWGGGDLCLTGDTTITVRRTGQVLDIELSSLRADDLVWDGVEFVEHGGLIDKGVQDVIEYQGVTATPGHEVLCEETGEFHPLGYAAAAGYTLAVEGSTVAVESAAQALSTREGALRE